MRISDWSSTCALPICIMPEVDAEFAKSLGQPEGDVEKLLADVRNNIEREVKVRAQARSKASVMDALVEACSFDVPKALVQNDAQGRVTAAREELKQRGVPNADSVPIPVEAFTAESERRVRLGLLVRSEEHTSELQSLMRISYAVFCLKKNKTRQ